MPKQSLLPNRGATLIEILVGSGLLSLILLVSVQLLIPALRAWSNGQSRSEVAQGLMITYTWIGDDVIRCSPGSLVVTEEGILAMRCALGQQADDSNEFTELIAYWPSDGDLYRAHKTVDPGASGPPNVTLADLEEFDSRRKVGSGVEELKFNAPKPWLLEIYLKFKGRERSAELRTCFTSIYAPLDPNMKQRDDEVEPIEFTWP